MGLLVADYPTQWGNTTSAYISSCTSEIRMYHLDLGGNVSVPYTVTELQDVTTQQNMYDENSNVIGSNAVTTQQLVTFTATSNETRPAYWNIVCDFAVYASKEQRLQNPNNFVERINVAYPAYANEFTSNNTVFSLLYSALANQYPSGIQD